MSTMTAPATAERRRPETFRDLVQSRPAGQTGPASVVTGRQLASILGVHPTTLRRMARSNQLPIRAVGVDSRPRYSVRSVLRWILEREPADGDDGVDCRLLTIAQAAGLLGCSRATAYRLLGTSSPPITPTPVGDETRFPAYRVLAYIDART